MDSGIAEIFGISCLEDVSLEDGGDSVVIEGNLAPEKFCPNCGGEHIHRQTKGHRLLHHAPIAGKSSKVQVLVQKRHCVECNHMWWPKIPFAHGQQRVTKSFVNYALELLRFGTILDVSKHLNVGWDLIKGLHKTYLAEKYQDIDMSEVEHVSIDEFSIAKRHKYMTTILDIKTGRILFAVEGRKKKDIIPILEDLKKKHLNLKLLPWI